MRLFCFAAIILAFMASVSQAENEKKSDSEIFQAALQKAREARIEQLEQMLTTGGLHRKVVLRAKAELKHLRSGKAMPKGWAADALRIEVNSPQVGQVGYLTWGPIDADRKDCVVKRVLGPTSVLAQVSWQEDHHIIARSWKAGSSATGFAPSAKVSSDKYIGPVLMFTNVITAGMRPNMNVKTTDLFYVEDLKTTNGEPYYVLRRLEVGRK